MKREMFMDGDGVVQAIETETHIFGLFGKFRALSNFHEEPLIVDGLKFRWSEAARQRMRESARRTNEFRWGSKSKD